MRVREFEPVIKPGGCPVRLHIKVEHFYIGVVRCDPNAAICADSGNQRPGRERITNADLAFILPTGHSFASRNRTEDLVVACSQPAKIPRSTVDLLLTAGAATPKPGSMPRIDLIEQASVAADFAEEDKVNTAVFSLERYGDPTLTLALMSEMLTSCENGAMYLSLQPNTVSVKIAFLAWKR